MGDGFYENQRPLTLVAVLVMLGCSGAECQPLLRLRVMDQTRAAFPNVLVIVKSLAGKGEIFRALTDQAGRCAGAGLARGTLSSHR